MGLILDSSVLIPAERKGQNAYSAVAALAKTFPGEELALSVITVVELAHGIARSNTPARQRLRSHFFTS